jgi:hypothetical protein
LGEYEVVLAAEAEAAIAKVAVMAVEQILGSDEDMQTALTEAFLVGQQNMLAKCIAAVEAIPHDLYCASLDEQYNRPCDCPQDNALDALRALQTP